MPLNKEELFNRTFDRAKRLESAIEKLNKDLESIDCHARLDRGDIKYVRVILARMALGKPQ